MARQNIAWGVTLQYDVQKVDTERLGREIFSTLADKGFNEKEHVLRVDTFPKELSSSVCQSLQQAAGATDSTDPYEGPIIVTKSASKCNHVVSLVCHEAGYAWGVTDRATHFAVKFNDGASNELLTKSTDPVTGVDVSSDTLQDAPVSRAYYKLSQVWDEILCNEFTSLAPIGKGVDLGAAPGGWTQVLRQHIGLSQVISIDPGVLAHRVTSLPGVVNVTADMASAQAVEAIAAVTEPISFLVCDACVDSFNILEKIVQLTERLDRNSFALPAAFVMTLKMPHKTPTSLDRNLEKVKKTIPKQLRKMASLSYEQQVNIRHQIVHLMANSDCERTLVVMFEA
jgi:23S rRNA U2552 (ribose-2'-O)-methylase RlmE/FtsJ